MIFGIGTDILRVDRIASIHERFGRRFVERLLMPEELAAFEGHKRPVRFLAMRFAAKEAIVKALGTGFAHGIWIRDVGFLQNAWGRPEVVFSPRGRQVADALDCGPGGVVFVSGATESINLAVKGLATGTTQRTGAERR